MVKRSQGWECQQRNICSKSTIKAPEDCPKCTWEKATIKTPQQIPFLKKSMKVGDLQIKVLFFSKYKCLSKNLLTNIILNCETGQSFLN